MAGTIFSIIPPIIAILMVILTRRVLLSLGVGIISAALLIEEFSITGTGMVILKAIQGVFYSDGEVNTWNVYIISVSYTHLTLPTK